MKPARAEEAEKKIRGLVEKYRIEAFAIGDGTAGRETEQFIKKLNLGLPVFLVNEDGASVYSASETSTGRISGSGYYRQGFYQYWKKTDGSTG